MLYADIRNIALNAIPGTGLSDYIYIGMIIFMFLGLFTYRKWTPFMLSALACAAIKAADTAFAGQTNAYAAYEFANMVAAPLLITLLYSKRG